MHNLYVPIEKKKLQELIKNKKKLQKYIYIFQFIDSTRFMASSLSNLVNNLPQNSYNEM